MGSARPAIDVPMIVKLYREGRLKLDQLISGRYRLESINEALASSRSGAAVRNVIVFLTGGYEILAAAWERRTIRRRMIASAGKAMSL